MTVNLTFLPISEWHNDEQPNRRWHKVRYTAALRLGFIPSGADGSIEVHFNGELAKDVSAHPGKTAFRGEIQIEGRTFKSIVVIGRPTTREGRYQLVTFWPASQHPDAHESYTDPLVDTAMDGTPLDIEVVATTMHSEYVKNAGVSPATLMKRLYEDQNVDLRKGLDRCLQLLEDAFQRERELGDRNRELDGRIAELAAQSRAPEAAVSQFQISLQRSSVGAFNREVHPFSTSETLSQIRLSDVTTLEVDAAEKVSELERLQTQSALTPRPNTRVESSNVAVLLRVEEGRRGRKDQPAILLHMSDGTIRANNWEAGYQARLQFARSLMGERIRTDVWGKFRWQDWFNNIFPIYD